MAHSEETRQKIGEGVRRANADRTMRNDPIKKRARDLAENFAEGAGNKVELRRVVSYGDISRKESDTMSNKS